MHLTVVEARDLNEAWWKLVRETLSTGYEYTVTRGSHVEGKIRKELDCAIIHVQYPGTRPLAPIVPDGVPAPSSDEYIEKDYLPYLISNAPKTHEEYTYGQYVEPQMLRIIETYKQGGFNNNQCTIMVGNENSLELPDPPCLRIIDTRVRYGKLHFFVYFRSWDLWGGLPSNLGGIQLMKEMMAKELGVEDGEIIAFSKGLHLYGESLESAKLAVRSNG